MSDLNQDGQRPVPTGQAPLAPQGPLGTASQKDNILFLMGGLLIGFVVAYLMFEAMATRQPPRLTPALRAQIVDGDDGGGGACGGGAAPAGAQAADPASAGAGPGAGAGGGPAMAEIQQLRDFVEKNPNDAAAVRKLADLNFDIQNWQRAQELYAHYLELKPNDPDVMTDLGITYRGLRQFDKALDLFQQAQKLDPEPLAVLLQRGRGARLRPQEDRRGQGCPGEAPADAAGQSGRQEARRRGGPRPLTPHDPDPRHHPPPRHPPDGGEELQHPAQGRRLRPSVAAPRSRRPPAPPSPRPWSSAPPAAPTSCPAGR